MKHIVAIFAVVALATTAHAQEGDAPADEAPQTQEEAAPEKANSVNLNPLGVVFGSYSLNYERLFGGTHGLLVEGLFSSSSNDTSSTVAYGGLVGYRWHWSGRQNSWFLGANVGYETGSGDGTVTTNGVEEKFDLSVSRLSATANIGKRWAWDFGLNITFRVGAGYGSYDVSTESDNPDVQDAVKTVDELLNFLPIAFDGELSLGWNF